MCYNHKYSIHERLLKKRYNKKEVCTSALLAPLFSYATITSLNKIIIHVSFRSYYGIFFFSITPKALAINLIIFAFTTIMDTCAIAGVE